MPLRQYLLADLAGRNRLALLTLSAAVGCLLLICCANVASLLLVRGISREREIAMRLTLGASRWRVVRHLLAESAVLSLAGGAAGLLVATWMTPILALLNPIRTDALALLLGDFRMDGRILAFALGVSMATGLVFGTLPALRAARIGDLGAALRRRDPRGGGRGSRWLAGLVVAEIAVAAILLVNGTLVVQSFARLRRIDLGFDPRHLLTLELSLPASKYPTHGDRVAQVERLVSTVRAVPGVTNAGVTTNIPLQTLSFDSVFTAEGHTPTNPADVPITAHRMVTSDYLQTLGARLVNGRLLDEHDREGARPVVVITEELARQAWPGGDPIGRRIRRGRAQDTFPWLTVVGVVADVKEDRLNFRRVRPAADGGVVEPVGPDVRRSRGHQRGGQKSDSIARQSAGGFWCDDDDRPSERVAGHRTLFSGIDDHARVARAVPGRLRPVQRDCVLGGPAHRRDWASAGPRCRQP